jgi:RHS repeat-associated protein
MVGHDDTDYPPSANYRGNLTTEQRWLNTTNTYVNTTRTFDVAGNVLTQKDPDGNTTTFSYTDAQNTYAHATKATNALNQIATAAYDYSTGKIVNTVGPNGEQTSYAYNDPLDRITTVQAPNGGSVSYTYPNYTTVIARRDQNTAGDGALKGQTIVDGFGRLLETDLYESSSQYIAATQAYNALGQVASTTNPSRSGDGLSYGTTYGYDSLGRIKQVAASDGVTSTMSYSGNSTTVTDPAGNAKSYTYDALGELQAVAETIQSGSVANTYYSYDTLGDLVCVSQTACPGSPVRSFTYDSLRRLTKAVNPESGTVTYAYDSAGNLLSRTDNRNYTTNYAYDALNRPKTVTYPSGSGSQNVTFTYDSGGSNSVGHLVSVSNGSTTNYTAFDSMGHVLSSNQVTIGTTYPFTYRYNLAGALTSETYPSGRVVTASYDGANRPSQVTGSVQGQNTNYLTQAWYWPQGAVGYYTLANNIVPAFAYNRHFQPTKVYAAVSDSQDSLLFMECYNWGAPNADSFFGTCPTWSGTNDNGNLYGSVTYSGGPAAQSSLTTYTGTFSYDGLNRLRTASDSGGWSRTYNYDEFGNMWVTNPSGPGLNSATPTSNIYNSKNQMSTATYDASGNQLTMGPYTLNYDAENRQYSETNTIGNPSAGYSYDGNGKRVARLVGAQTTVYVYDAFGALTAAYSNGGMGKPPCHTCYLIYDHLGTTRLITDSSAKVIARHDFLPFGEEIPGGIAGRSSSQFGPGLDNVNQKFTGQERDAESGLDYLQARYFSGALGRLLSPDPHNAGANPMLPQSWNAYSYVGNNPLAYVDPLGMDPILNSGITFSTTVYGNSSDFDGGGGGGNFRRPGLLGLDPASGYQTSQSILYSTKHNGNVPSSKPGSGSQTSAATPAPPEPAPAQTVATPPQQTPKNPVTQIIIDVATKAFCFVADASGLTSLPGATNSNTAGVGVGGGAGVGLFVGINVEGSIQAVADQSGNAGVAVTIGGNPGWGVWGAGANGGAQAMRSSATTIDDLGGWALDAGGAIGDGAAVGFDYSVAPDGAATATATLGPGIGLRYSASANATYTFVPVSVNCQ